MISVSDILAILDKVPIWRDLKALPGKVAALEKRVAELEGTATAQPVVAGPACQWCRSTDTQLEKAEPHPIFGEVGMKIGTYRCNACGKETEKKIDTMKD